MTTPKIVVFDLGKVLVDFDYGIAAANLARRCRRTADEINRLIATSPLLFRYETGLMTREEFFSAVSAETGFCGDIDEFGGFFSDIFAEIGPMVALHGALRQRGIPTYIFSNTNDLAIAHIRRNFPFFSNFDGYILSYEVGSMKPEPKIYDALEKMSDRRGAEVLYLDDRPENVEAGAARGWQVILHETPQKSRAAVEQFGLLNHR
jgi:FMN phosphatase YigB (HAD superfamily)